MLRPGDVLLYRPMSLFGWLIRRHTGFPISHVEVFIGQADAASPEGYAVASRDRIGTGRYPLRTSGLVTICRPRVPFDLVKALVWFGSQPHRPYGWLELLQFLDYNVEGDGIVCSPFATLFSRAGTLDPFNGAPYQKIAPFQFELSLAYTVLPYAASDTVAA